MLVPQIDGGRHREREERNAKSVGGLHCGLAAALRSLSLSEREESRSALRLLSSACVVGKWAVLPTLRYVQVHSNNISPHAIGITKSDFEPSLLLSDIIISESWKMNLYLLINELKSQGVLAKIRCLDNLTLGFNPV